MFFLKDEIIKHLKKSCILVFEDEQIKKSFIKYFQDDYCFSKIKYLTLKELEDELFLTNKASLLGLKRSIALYNSLSEEMVEYFKLNNHFEAFSFADKFFKFFEELQENSITKLDNKFFQTTADCERYQKWQEKEYQALCEVKKGYRSYLEKAFYSDRIFQEDICCEELLEEFEKLIIVGIDRKTPREQRILARLQDKINIVELTTNVETSSLTRNLESIKVYRCSDEFTQVVDCASKVDRENYDLIIDLANNSTKYAELFDNNKFDLCYATRFFCSGIYSFLNCLEVLLAASKQEKINGYRLEECFSNYHFKNYYQLKDEQLSFIRKKLSEGVIFFSRQKVISEKLAKDMERVNQFQTAEDLLEFLQGLDLARFQDRYFDTVLDKLFGQTLVLMNIYKDLPKIKREIRGAEWLKLLLFSCEHLKLEYALENNQAQKLRVIDYKNIWFLENKNLVFLNANESVLSAVEKKNTFFTEKQKKVLGIMTKQEALVEKREKFLAICYRNKSVRIYGVEDKNGLEIMSSFVEEMFFDEEKKIIKQNQRIEGDSLYESYLGFFKQETFSKSVSEENLVAFNRQEIGEAFCLSATGYKVLKACPLKYFLDYIVKLNRVCVEESEDIKANVIGEIVHEIFGIVAGEMKNFIGQELGFSEVVKNIEIKKIIQDVFRKRKDLLPLIYGQDYVSDVVFPFLEDSVKNFFIEVCAKKFEFKDIACIYVEEEGLESLKKPKITEVEHKQGNIPVLINGRADLRIELKNGHAYIFDFKTGSQTDDFQLNLYSEFYYGLREQLQNVVTSGCFYKVFDGKEDWVVKKDVREKIKEVCAGLVQKAQYAFGLTTTECMYCNHEGICRKNG